MRRPSPDGVLVCEPTTYPRLTGFVLHVADADRERYVLEIRRLTHDLPVLFYTWQMLIASVTCWRWRGGVMSRRVLLGGVSAAQVDLRLIMS